ncbi:hypothetical protein SMD44_04207 [Streptomyces alboflavus]|uniref:Uncharacterized protein n=1 Tax=Streptomyces alboflavus TaxID=67267 RepID=A0A1Z1WE64_9ACTN|nr:hypothetical protein [Streptomyces alboflavus]ARX84753.1 hypothetical protein SMD44_04207 [Streptomyces alboflavus]
MSAVGRKWWRLAPTVVCVFGAVAASVSAFVYALPWPALALAVGCLLIARYLGTQVPAPSANEPDNDAGEAGR